jgi:hypothetical protein
LLVACSGRPTTEPASLGATARLEIYERAFRPFAVAVLARPAPGSIEGPAFDLAPLLLQEIEPGSAPDAAKPGVVQFSESTVDVGAQELDRLTYLWRYSTEGRGVQGIRATLGSDGFPLWYEVLADSSAGRLIFVSSTLEEAAASQFGPPLEGRSHAIERSVTEAPDVVVAGVLEPGPMPLGPFAYLTREDHDVSTLICRCMPSQVEQIVDGREYRLERLPRSDSIEPWAPLDPARTLRLPAGPF